MTDPSKSMIELTEKVIKADLASKKKKYITFRASRLSYLSLSPIFLYFVYHFFFPYGNMTIFHTNSLGDQAYIINTLFFGFQRSYREMYRPEIYYADRAELKKEFMNSSLEIIAKNESTKNYKPYIWH